jgi:hypothetical protein
MLNTVRLEIVLILRHDWCTVYSKCTIGSKIALDAPDGTLGEEARVKARFGPFGDGANLDAR